MNPSCFVVSRPDGFTGVEVDASDQLTPNETRKFAAELIKAADKADRILKKNWPKKVCTVEYTNSGYLFKCGKMHSFWGSASASELEELFLSNKITHIDSTFGDNEETPESPRKKLYTRSAYLKWWRSGEDDSDDK